MITEGLRVLLFGMAGIFIVMSIIILITLFLKSLGKGKQKEEQSE